MRLCSVSTRVVKAAQCPTLVHPVLADRATGGREAAEGVPSTISKNKKLTADC
jgi:hypothetical protein